MKFLLKMHLIFSLLLITLASNVLSQKIEKKTYIAAYTNTPPLIDGSIKDSCWSQVEWGNSFIQSQPTENKPPSQQTAFKILYDDNNLYVFVRAYDK